MNNNEKDNKIIIVKSFADFKNGHWKTLDEISESTGINSKEVAKIVMNYDEFVQSSNTGLDGIPKFTTKENFRQNESFMHKVLGAFKNRID